MPEKMSRKWQGKVDSYFQFLQDLPKQVVYFQISHFNSESV